MPAGRSRRCRAVERGRSCRCRRRRSVPPAGSASTRPSGRAAVDRPAQSVQGAGRAAAAAAAGRPPPAAAPAGRQRRRRRCRRSVRAISLTPGAVSTIVGRPDRPASITTSGTSETGTRNGSRKAWQRGSSRSSAGASMPTRSRCDRARAAATRGEAGAAGCASAAVGAQQHQQARVQAQRGRRPRTPRAPDRRREVERRAEIADRGTARAWGRQARPAVDLRPQQSAGRAGRAASSAAAPRPGSDRRSSSAPLRAAGRRAAALPAGARRAAAAPAASLSRHRPGTGSRSSSRSRKRGLAITRDTGAPEIECARSRASRAAPQHERTRDPVRRAASGRAAAAAAARARTGARRRVDRVGLPAGGGPVASVNSRTSWPEAARPRGEAVGDVPGLAADPLGRRSPSRRRRTRRAGGGRAAAGSCRRAPAARRRSPSSRSTTRSQSNRARRPARGPARPRGRGRRGRASIAAIAAASARGAAPASQRQRRLAPISAASPVAVDHHRACRRPWPRAASAGPSRSRRG